MKFTSSSFEVSVIYQGDYSNIEIKFNSYIFIKTMMNYRKYSVKNKSKISSRHLECANKSIVLCPFNIHVPRHSYINVSLLSLNYNGPDVGYCKYGGLAIYDYVGNTMKEEFLQCDNWLAMSSNDQFNKVVISNKWNIFLIFYSYEPYSDIDIQMIIQPTACQGIHIQR